MIGNVEKGSCSADARFAMDQDGAVRRRNHIDLIEQGPELCAGTNHFQGPRLTLERRSHSIQQFFAPDGLGKKAGSSALDGSFTVRVGSVRGDEHDWDTIVSSSELALKLQAVNARQMHIDDQARCARG